MPSVAELSTYWYLAASEPLGIWLSCPDPVRLKSLLYSARVRTKDPALSRLQIRTAPPPLEHQSLLPGLGPTKALWIINPPEPADAS